MEEIVEIFQEVEKYKNDDETITDFFDRKNILYSFCSGYEIVDNYIKLTYKETQHIIKTHDDIKKFFRYVFRDKILSKLM